MASIQLPGMGLSVASFTLSGALVAGSIQDTGLSTGVVHSDASGNFTSSTIVNADVDAAAAIAGTKISPDFGSQAVVTTGTITGAGLLSTAATLQFSTAVSAPLLNQADNTTNSATAQTMTLQAQNATGTTSVGGQLNVTSGTGTSAAGVVNIQTGGTTRFAVAATGLSIVGVSPLQWTTVGAIPTISQVDNTTNSATGSAFTVQAQNATGTTANGGDLVLKSGTGTSAAGSVKLQSGATLLVQGNATGLGFFAAPPVAKPTVSGSKGANAALSSLMTALANLGLVTDSTS